MGLRSGVQCVFNVRRVLSKLPGSGGVGIGHPTPHCSARTKPETVSDQDFRCIPSVGFLASAMMKTAATTLLSPDQVEQFNQDGYLHARGFYDCATEIEPIQSAIYQIIGLVIEQHRLTIARPPFTPEKFDAGFNEMIRIDRRLGAVVYDAVKQIPDFIRLTASPKHDLVLRELRGSALPGVAAAGNGIRIDNPAEDKFKAVWHQDYLYNLRSLDGLVFWAPLVKISPDLGQLILAKGSHKAGLKRIVVNDSKTAGKPGAYAWHLEHEQDVVGHFPHFQFETVPGDLLILDYLTLHASGTNVSQRSRWTMQMRYFNFCNEQGRRIDWSGGVNSGARLKDVHPELVVELPG